MLNYQLFIIRKLQMAKNSKKNNHIAHSLYRLIASMSSGQKTNLKKQARALKKGEKQKYIVLFEFIDTYILDRNDIQNLPRSLSESGMFAHNSDLYATATYLFDRIMDQLRTANNSPASRHIELLQTLQNIHYLFYHDMYAECDRMIKHAKALAKMIDRPAYLLELQTWEARVAARMNYIPWKMEAMQAELDETLSNLKATYSTFLESQQLFLALRNAVDSVSKEAEILMEKTISTKDTLTQKANPRLHYWKLVQLQYCSELVPFVKEKHSNKFYLDDTLTYLKQNLEFLLHDGKVIAEEEPVNYLSVLENYLTKCLEQKKEESIQILESEFVKKYIEKEEIHRYRTICYFRLLYFISFNQFKEACKYIRDENLEKNLKTRQHLITDTRMSVIRYSCMQAYYFTEDYERALVWADLIVASPRSQSNPMVYLMSEISRVICLLETGRLSSIYSLVENLIKKFKRRPTQSSFLPNLLLNIRYASVPDNKLYRRKAIEQRAKLENQLQKNPRLKVYGPLLAWIDKRMSPVETTLSIEVAKYDH